MCSTTTPGCYLYVGPSIRVAARASSPRIRCGAAITYAELVAAGDTKGAGMDFFLEGAALLLGQP